MKIEIELWMLYFFEARHDKDALLGLWSLFRKVKTDYPIVEAFAIRAMFHGYMQQLRMKNKKNER